nr:hypothetical protein [Buchnera aphidicola]
MTSFYKDKKFFKFFKLFLIVPSITLSLIFIKKPSIIDGSIKNFKVIWLEKRFFKKFLIFCIFSLFNVLEEIT